MTRVHDPDFVADLSTVTDAVHDHGAAVAVQLEHGGLRAMETWHREYRRDHPDLEQLAVSRPPWPLRVLDGLGVLDYDEHVLSTDEVYDLAAAFGRSAAAAADAGYDVVHLAGANMGIVQQFLSPFYNRRDDEFADGVRFLELVHDEVRERAGDVPLMTKVPAETAAPPFVRRRLGRADAVRVCERLADYGYDALVPVTASVFWDASVVRGAYPARAWADESLQSGYEAAFGGPLRSRLVALGNRVESWVYDFDPAWNAGLCRAVRDRVDVPVLAEGGIRGRGQMDRLLGRDCDMVGLGRPFYAEPRLPARLLGTGDDADVDGAGGDDARSDGTRGVPADTRAVCESCNNCAVAQAAGATGVCRTPHVLERAGRLRKEGAYDRPGSERPPDDDADG
jgi:2,4-dienoyl-CoA reductase-like NADH-dependent reductase (Old Yellow Enzyme family)